MAKKLGVSKSTVSRALSNYPDISSATKERVREAAERYGYQPSTNAQSIKTGLLRSAGIVVWRDSKGLAPSAVLDLIGGISLRLQRDGWTLIIAMMNCETDLPDIQRLLIDRKKVDGVIICDVKNDDPRIESLGIRQIPSVCCGHAAGYLFPALDVENGRGVGDAIHFLVKAGHRRVAVFQVGHTTTRTRSGSVTQIVQERNGLESSLEVTCIVAKDLPKKRSFLEAAAWIKHPFHKPQYETELLNKVQSTVRAALE